MYGRKEKRASKFIPYVIIISAIIISCSIASWIYYDMKYHGIDILNRANDLFDKELPVILGLITSVALLWVLIGKQFKFIRFKYIYAVMGTIGINLTLYAYANYNVHLFVNNICEKAFQIVNFIWNWLLLRPLFLVIGLMVVIAIALFVGYKLVDWLYWNYNFDDIKRTVFGFVATVIVYLMFFKGLLILNNHLYFCIGLLMVTYFMCLLWGINMTNNVIYEEDWKKAENIVVRIIKDIAIGMVVSLLIYFSLSYLYQSMLGDIFLSVGIEIANFSVQDIFFTQLSLVFLVISFVTLLANKTQTVYWVDVIQYRLVKPNHTSIVDISCYIFSNLLLSLIAFVFPQFGAFAIVGFILTIFLLGFMCIKLLISFFGINALKIELDREYQKALEFRKLIYKLQYTLTNNDESRSIWIQRECDKKCLEDYGSNLENEISGKTMQKICDGILLEEKRIPKEDKNKLIYYARKFSKDVNRYEFMRNRIYENIIGSIEKHEIGEVAEQIRFLLKYKEYEYAYNSMTSAVEKCPIAFLDVFSESLEEIEPNKELVKYIYELFSKLHKYYSENWLIKKSSYKSAIMNMTEWASSVLDKKEIEDRLKESKQNRSEADIVAIYTYVFLKSYKRELENSRRLCRRNKEETDQRFCHLMKVDEGTDLILEVLTWENTNCVCELLTNYRVFLNDIKRLFYFEDVKEIFEYQKIAYEIEICDLNRIYLEVERQHDADKISVATALRIINIIVECCNILDGIYIKSCPQVLEKYDDLKLRIKDFYEKHDKDKKWNYELIRDISKKEDEIEQTNSRQER